jgi:iron(III) transport system substrate-binding protein
VRLRVIGVAPGKPDVTTLAALTDPALKGRIGIGKPGAGTTAGHLAAIYVAWGPQKYEAWLRGLAANQIKVLGGNGPVAVGLADGSLDAGLTDNDDVFNVNAERSGGDVRAVLPDQGDGMGTLAVPTTAGLVTGTTRRREALMLIDHIVSARTERLMADKGFTAGSVRDGGATGRLAVDYAAVSAALPEAVRLARAILEDGK